MHLDMNSYFASVEQQANPFLRNRPVGVCAYLSDNGTIIASSVEAKVLGVKTGCKVQEAKRLIPDIFLVENEPAKYRCVTERIFKILREYTDAMEPYSIDEAFLNLTGWAKDFKAAEQIACEIKRRICDEVGEWLKCSIGISYTKFLAKFAGDIAFRGSILIISEANIDQELDRELTDAWGIGEKVAVKLRCLGISNLYELKKTDPLKLRHYLGVYGYHLWANVNGQEISEIKSETDLPKSIGHSYCLPKKTDDKKYLLKILFKLCEKTGRRLRSLGLEAGSINLYLAYVYGGHLNKTFYSFDKVFTTQEIFNPICSFIEQTDLLIPIKMIAVSVNRLTADTGQLSIFYNRVKNKNLSLLIDKLNDKYGEYAVRSGLMLGTDNLAHDRVGFRKTLEVNNENTEL